MEIVPIFGNILFAFKFTGQTEDEFNRLFSAWQDPEYLEDFFERNESDLRTGYWRNMSIEDAIYENYKYVQNLEKRFLDLSQKSENEQLAGLEKIFTPLSDYHSKSLNFDKRKAKSTWLRLYAIRVDKSVYIITGGGIKLTQKMQNRRHTMIELRKLESCKNFLMQKGIDDIDDIIEFIEA